MSPRSRCFPSRLQALLPRRPHPTRLARALMGPHGRAGSELPRPGPAMRGALRTRGALRRGVLAGPFVELERNVIERPCPQQPELRLADEADARFVVVDLDEPDSFDAV